MGNLQYGSNDGEKDGSSRVSSDANLPCLVPRPSHSTQHVSSNRLPDDLIGCIIPYLPTTTSTSFQTFLRFFYLCRSLHHYITRVNPSCVSTVLFRIYEDPTNRDADDPVLYVRRAVVIPRITSRNQSFAGATAVIRLRLGLFPNLEEVLVESCVCVVERGDLLQNRGEHLRKVGVRARRRDSYAFLLHAEDFASSPRLRKCLQHGVSALFWKRRADLPAVLKRVRECVNTNCNGSFFDSLPSLEELELEGLGMLSVRSLRNAVKTCPNLRRVAWTGGGVDHVQTVLFPDSETRAELIQKVSDLRIEFVEDMILRSTKFVEFSPADLLQRDDLHRGEATEASEESSPGVFRPNATLRRLEVVAPGTYEYGGPVPYGYRGPRRCWNNDDARLIQHYPSLVELRVEMKAPGSLQVPDSALEHLLNLRKLTLLDIAGFDGSCLRMLDKLELLRLRLKSQDDSRIVGNVADDLTLLREFDYESTFGGEKSIVDLRHWHKLVSRLVAVRFGNLTFSSDGDVPVLPQQSPLRRASFSGADCVCGGGIAALLPPSVRELEFLDCKLIPSDLASLPVLRRLSVRGRKSDLCRIEDLVEFPQLDELSLILLPAGSVNDAIFRCFPALSFLTLCHVPAVGIRPSPFLSIKRSLTILHLRNSTMTDEVLSSLTNLEELSVHQVVSLSGRFLGHLRQLRVLDVYCSDGDEGTGFQDFRGLRNLWFLESLSIVTVFDPPTIPQEILERIQFVKIHG